MPRPNTGYRLVPTDHGYELRWTEPGGHSRRSRLGTSNLQAAELRRAQIVQEHRGLSAAPGDELTVSAILSAYEREHCPNAAAGQEVISAVLPRLVEHFGHLTPRQVTVDLCVSYKPPKMVGGGNVSQASIRNHLAYLGAAFSWAVKTKRMLKQDVPYIARPRASKPRDRVLTSDEHKSLLDAAASKRKGNRMTRVERFLHIAREAPWRRARIERLTWFSVNWEARFIDPRNPAERATKKRVAVLPISDDLYPVLREMYEQRESEFVLDTDRDIYCSFVRIVTAAKLGPEVTPHTYRHTWATDAIMSGVSVEETAKALGNTPAMVRSTYAHLQPDYLRPAMNFRKPPARGERETG